MFVCICTDTGTINITPTPAYTLGNSASLNVELERVYKLQLCTSSHSEENRHFRKNETKYLAVLTRDIFLCEF